MLSHRLFYGAKRPICRGQRAAYALPVQAAMLPAAVLACALDLLGRSSTAAPVRFIDRPPIEATRGVEAFVERDPPVIYLLTSTETFRQALHPRPGWSLRDACRKIASIIVHEEWHLRHGTDEQGAYYAQLTTLAALQAEPQTIARSSKR
jgi:hypothetical protein